MEAVDVRYTGYLSHNDSVGYTQIIVLSEVGNTKLDSKEIIEEIISLLHCYSMKLYSKRNRAKIQELIANTEESDTNE